MKHILRATPSAAGPLAAGDQLTGELIAWLIDGLDWIRLDWIDWMIDWLIDWLIDSIRFDPVERIVAFFLSPKNVKK